MGMDLDYNTELDYNILNDLLDAAHIEANEEHEKVDALRQDVKRLRNLLRRCQVFAGDFGVGRERLQLIEDLKDELAKE